MLPECYQFINKWAVAAELGRLHDKDSLSLKGNQQALNNL